MNIDVTNRLIRNRLGDLLEAWLSDSRISPVYCTALVGYYRALELKALIGAQEVTE